MCDCPLCKTVRETFDVQEGQEHEIVEKLIESTHLLSGLANAINHVLEQGEEKLNQQQVHRDDFMAEHIDRSGFESIYEQNELDNEDNNERNIL